MFRRCDVPANPARWTSTITAALALAGLAVLAGIGDLRSAPPEAGFVQAGGAAVDQSGDPLPMGALARMGTLRWRHADPVTFVAFGPDDKSVLTASQPNVVRLWDRATGKELQRFDLGKGPMGQAFGQFVVGNAIVATNGFGPPRMAVSADGRMLAGVISTVAPGATASTIKLWDVATGKEIREFKGPSSGLSAVVFAPDGKALAGRGNDRVLYVYETATGKEVRKLQPPQQAGNNNNVRFFVGGFGDSAGCAFSPDGKTLALAEFDFNNNQISTYVRIMDATTGNQIHRFDAPQAGISSITYSPNGKLLAYAHLTTIYLRDTDTGKEVRQVNTNAGITGMIFSAESKHLLARGHDQVIRFWEVDTGKNVRELGKAPGPRAGAFGFGLGGVASRDLAISHDGKTLLAGSGQTVRFWDLANAGKEIPLPGGGHRGSVSAVVITPDGKTMLSHGADNVIRRWDAVTGKELAQRDDPPGTSAVALSPDGKTAALAVIEGAAQEIRLVAADTGTELHKLKAPQNGAAALVFSPDGKVLAALGAVANVIQLYDVALGAELKQLTIPGVNPPNGGRVVMRGPMMVANGQGLAFSPDGRLLAAQIGSNVGYMAVGNVAVPQGGPANNIRIWDVGTGKEMRPVALPPGRSVTNIAFSPDSRLLGAENADETVSLWEIASGKERALLGKPRVAQKNMGGMGVAGVNFGFGMLGGAATAASPTLAFSPDGEIVAARGPDKTVRLFDVPRAKEIGSFKGHEGDIRALAFGPDGRTLASASADTTILLWDMNYVKRDGATPVVELKTKQVTDLWSDLSASDAVKASRSMQTLIAAPKQTVSFLRDQLKPAAPLDVKKLDRWVADLDSDNFKTRVKAVSELEKTGEQAIPALQKVLKSQPTLESRRRVEPLIEKLTIGVLSAEQIRTVRAVEVLEKLGTPDARMLLESLVKGAPGALTTRNAQAALARLDRKTPQ